LFSWDFLSGFGAAPKNIAGCHAWAVHENLIPSKIPNSVNLQILLLDWLIKVMCLPLPVARNGIAAPSAVAMLRRHK
jgi:hypothetical protein